MHLLVSETRTLDEGEMAVDLGQSPADILFLSFSDSDLGAAATAWSGMGAGRPSLRLASLARLRHPMSVDLYVDRVIARARCVVVRLLGSLEYWRYGAEEVSAACRRDGIALAIVPGDGTDDGRLAAMSTVPAPTLSRLDALLRAGGVENVRAALALAADLAGLASDVFAPVAEMPSAGEHALSSPRVGDENEPVAAIVFYRSHLLSGDIAPITALADALVERGLRPRALFASSLKDAFAATWVAENLRTMRPSVVLNATGFSARQGAAGDSPLDAAGVPVLQLVLAVGSREAWMESSRGLSQTDLAMQVVLPELDGRLLTTAISFKAEDDAIAALEWSRVVHRPDPSGIALAADRAAGWARLAATARGARRVAIVLSDYPGGQRGHAVGLDTFASLAGILGTLDAAGYDTGGATPDAAALTRGLCDAPSSPILSIDAYQRAFSALPGTFRESVLAAWGEPSADFSATVLRVGNIVMAVQPDRGLPADRKANYHDPALPPCHAYVAFYLWLRDEFGADAMIHLGAHGTLEWLPGKSVAVSEACAPVALLRGMPVIYPFIVNNPGEAACAKRRLGAVTIGHLTPPLRPVGAEGSVAELERMIDEYAAADGLDRRRAALLRGGILVRARDLGLAEEAGLAGDEPDDAALTRLDAYLCDVKELQVRDGLHVFGQSLAPARADAFVASIAKSSPESDESRLRARLDACAAGEKKALLAALDGRFVQPGPGGAPSRGRADVLPTGRNIAAIDPRAIPTRSALALAARAADEVLRRHRHDHGEWPRALVLNLWGSTTMRTGGEDFAMALVLLGARPVWDSGSARVTGIEILPLAVLDRPRVDVTLRISGLFRDAFPAQIALFDTAVRAIAARDEAADFNPLAGVSDASRLYGPAPMAYGAGIDFSGTEMASRGDLGTAYLAASSFAYGAGMEGSKDPAGFAARVGGADAFVHVQDHRETDVLDGSGFAAHDGGFSAAADSLGGAPALYHADISDPGTPRARPMAEEIARIARGRVGSPAWVAGMMAHGYRGAGEIARGVEGLFAFACALTTRFDRQFDLVFDATLGDPNVDAFLRANNPAARAAMFHRFRDARARGLWQPRRNAAAELLDAVEP
jgi:cobaltochelatase CobN